MRQRLEVVTAVLVVIILLAVLVWAVPQFLAPLPGPTPPVQVPPGAASPGATRTRPASTVDPANPEPRAVVVSLAGLRPDLADRYVQQGQMPHLAQLIAGGSKAEYAQAVYPALAAPSYAAIASGARADVTGIVANTFHVSGTILYETVDGLATPLPVEPLWATAARQGKRAATVCWPGSNPGVLTHQANYVVGHGVRDVDSNLHPLRFTRVVTESTAWTGLPASFSPWLEGTLTIVEGGESKYPVYALLIDTTDDKRENYDTLLLDMDRVVNERTPRGRFGEWIAVETDPFVRGGAYFKVTSSDLHDFRVYQSAICYNAAAPTDLLRALNAQVGFFPADPDRQALERGWITAADYLAMLEHQCQWVVNAALYVDSVYHPDLLFIWQGSPAAAQERFLLVADRQPGYSSTRAKEYEAHIQQAYRIADVQLGRLMGAFDLESTALFAISDHGTAPVRTVVNVNKVLADRGLLILEPGSGRVDIQQTQAYAVAAGGTVHVYVNLSDREVGGTVSPGGYDLVCESVIAALQDVRDETGSPAFPLILKREEADRIRLNHPHSGDVIAFAAPGYLVSSDLGRGQVFEVTTSLGQAGYEPIQPTMHAVFVAGGYGIRSGVYLAPISTLDLAPTVARLLKLRPAAHWQGQVLTDIIER